MNIHTIVHHWNIKYDTCKSIPINKIIFPTSEYLKSKLVESKALRPNDIKNWRTSILKKGKNYRFSISELE